MGNGQKRELSVFFGQKRAYLETNNSGRECCWPYLIGQHPLSPVFGQKRPGTPGNSYFAQLPPVFGHSMFLSGGLLDYSNIMILDYEDSRHHGPLLCSFQLLYWICLYKNLVSLHGD